MLDISQKSLAHQYVKCYYRGETQSIPAGRPSAHVLGVTFVGPEAEEKQLVLFPQDGDGN